MNRYIGFYVPLTCYNENQLRFSAECHLGGQASIMQSFSDLPAPPHNGTVYSHWHARCEWVGERLQSASVSDYGWATAVTHAYYQLTGTVAAVTVSIYTVPVIYTSCLMWP